MQRATTEGMLSKCPSQGPPPHVIPSPQTGEGLGAAWGEVSSSLWPHSCEECLGFWGSPDAIPGPLWLTASFPEALTAGFLHFSLGPAVGPAALAQAFLPW